MSAYRQGRAVLIAGPTASGKSALEYWPTRREVPQLSPTAICNYCSDLRRLALGYAGDVIAVNEPINLHEWKVHVPAEQGGRLFTGGRPGRGTFGRGNRPIHEHTINLWVTGLPKATVLHIVSLLGKKPRHNFSEFSYYPFRSSYEVATKPTFQEWLEQRYPGRFVVHEFPTVDLRPIPRDVLDKLRRCVPCLLENGSAVVIVDSAGAQRTARVCEALGYRR